jgi:hypothetical protein
MWVCPWRACQNLYTGAQTHWQKCCHQPLRDPDSCMSRLPFAEHPTRRQAARRSTRVVAKKLSSTMARMVEGPWVGVEGRGAERGGCWAGGGAGDRGKEPRTAHQVCASAYWYCPAQRSTCKCAPS